MATRTGLEAKIFYTQWITTAGGTPHTSVAPTVPGSFPATGTPLDTANSNAAMVELTNVTSVNVNISKATADITTRGASGWRIEIPTLKTATIDFQMIWDSDDVGFANVWYCFNNNKPLYMCVMDGDLNDSTTDYRTQGLYTPFGVTECSRAEELEGALTASVNLSVTWVSSDYAPYWVDRTISA